jgi:hypothetical protein
MGIRNIEVLHGGEDALCPICGLYTLKKLQGWTEGGPVSCTNAECESNFPEEEVIEER